MGKIFAVTRIVNELWRFKLKKRFFGQIQKKGCQKGGITKSKRSMNLLRLIFLKDEIFYNMVR